MKIRTDILGVQIDRLNKQELHSKIRDRLKAQSLIRIFTPNPEIILRARKEERLKDIINSADILVPDGIGVVIASRILSDPLPERLPGIEVGEFLLYLANKLSFSVFLLGGAHRVADNAAKMIKDKFPDINICGTHHGYFSSAEANEVLKYVRSKEPDIIFVCMGSPRQEEWIWKNAGDIPSLKVAIGLGGSLDVWSGKLKRAPRLLRALCLEWLWRIILEPKRIIFLLRIPIFFALVIKQKLSKATNKSKINGEIDH